MMRVLTLAALLFGLLTGLVSPLRVEASPGLCTGPVCADDITRSAKNHWQLVLKLNDQLGHREKVVMNCRAGQLSPMSGPVDRAYATAIGRRACRLAGEG
ncbi:hypothetical protein [Synechococcus sp. NOUM97013]|uniref:hypothetical protein n=1 Tax=Synechococcus sp. NOUM97013 TaxID=1442555 RepID=UPI0016472AF8|nr:hypothetical protein [Synechococcus sp. NOUM97013]QNI73489.1 putative conserved secreted protein [Synechococcus sp. NOUM97013]